jgi:hypothetical protein
MSRSFITGATVPAGGRNILNPVTTLGGAVLVTSGTGGSCVSFTRQQVGAIREIENLYTLNLSKQKYEDIPRSLEQYIKLNAALNKTRVAFRSNSDITLLLRIVSEALIGAIYAYGLNVTNIEYSVQVNYLQDVIDELLSGQNVKPAFDQNIGGLSIMKELKLAPLYLHYIRIYGMPQPGDGFELAKLQIVYETLINSGIDPGIVNMDLIPAPITCTTNAALVEMYYQLSLVTNSVKTLQDTYAAGNVYAVANILTSDVYNELVMQLEQLSAEPTDADRALTAEEGYQAYERIRTNTSSGLISLNKAVVQHTELVETQLKLETAQEKVAILLDPVKLQEYIEQLNNQARSKLFPDSTVQVRKATLKPEYTEYVKLYGYPAGGAFDPDKMAEIMRRMGIVTNTSLEIAGLQNTVNTATRQPDNSMDAYLRRKLAEMPASNTQKK